MTSLDEAQTSLTFRGLQYKASIKSDLGRIISYFREDDDSIHNILEELLIYRCAIYVTGSRTTNYRAQAIKFSDWFYFWADKILMDAGLPVQEYIVSSKKNLGYFSPKNNDDEELSIIDLIMKDLDSNPAINTKRFVLETLKYCYLSLLPLSKGDDSNKKKEQALLSARVMIGWANEIREYSGLPLFERVDRTTIAIPAIAAPPEITPAYSAPEVLEVQEPKEGKVEEVEEIEEENILPTLSLGSDEDWSEY